MQVFMSAVLYLSESNTSASVHCLPVTSVHCLPVTFVIQHEEKVTICILSLVRETRYSRKKQPIQLMLNMIWNTQLLCIVVTLTMFVTMKLSWLRLQLYFSEGQIYQLHEIRKSILLAWVFIYSTTKWDFLSFPCKVEFIDLWNIYAMNCKCTLQNVIILSFAYACLWGGVWAWWVYVFMWI